MKKLGRDFYKLFSDILRIEMIDVKPISDCLIFTQKMQDPFENTNLNLNIFYSLIDEFRYIKY